VSWPSKVLQRAGAEALIKYVEVRALVGGTTAIQGAPHTTRPVDGWLVRILDNERFVGGADRVLTAALQKDRDALRKDAKKPRAGHVLIYHDAEGQVGSIVTDEFVDLSATGCLQPGLIGVHASALAEEHFAHWRAKLSATDGQGRGTAVWSPFSNLWLYHETTDVVTAAEKGLRIALGSDWAPSGTKHVLGELKLADLLNQQSFAPKFSDEELCKMVTANAGDALAVALERPLGRLAKNAAADVLVVERHHQDVHRNLIEATERDIQLVVIRGQPFYGTPALMRAAGAKEAERLTVAGRTRAVKVRQPEHADAKLNWPQVRDRLDAVRDDPIPGSVATRLRLSGATTTERCTFRFLKAVHFSVPIDNTRGKAAEHTSQWNVGAAGSYTLSRSESRASRSKARAELPRVSVPLAPRETAEGDESYQDDD
jgi:5-methylthioadenosine/S-adenosylhomocysteine deaminase